LGSPGGGEKTFHSQYDSLNRTRTSGGVVPVQSFVLMSDDTTSVIVLMTLLEACVTENHISLGKNREVRTGNPVVRDLLRELLSGRSGLLLPVGTRCFSFLQNVEGSAKPPGVTLSIDLHLVLRLRMS